MGAELESNQDRTSSYQTPFCLTNSIAAHVADRWISMAENVQVHKGGGIS